MIRRHTLIQQMQHIQARLVSHHAMAWMLVPGSLWFVAGLYLDGWAHNHNKVDNTFFTPWHAVFYSGYLVVALTLLIIIAIAQRNGTPWHTALPIPLRTAVVAAPMFALAGVSDLWWHTTYGFENGIELLLSPPHLMLAGSMFFIIGAGARLDDGTKRGWQRLPYIVSAGAAWSVITFMWQFNHPYGIVWPETLRAGSTGIMTGIAGTVANSALTAGVALFLMQKRMPYGALTGILLVNALGIALMGDEYRFAIGAFVAGIVSEGIRVLMQQQPWMRQIRTHAFVVAFMTSLCYMLVIKATTVILWPVHIWLGTVCLAGVAGWALTLIVPAPTRSTHND